MKRDRYQAAEAIGQLRLTLGDLPTGCEPSGAVLAVKALEGREAEAGRAVPFNVISQNASSFAGCVEVNYGGGESWDVSCGRVDRCRFPGRNAIDLVGRWVQVAQLHVR